MRTELRLPVLGDVMVEGTLAAWLKEDGASVSRGEPLYKLETDKVSYAVEAPAAGVLRHIVAAGATVAVGTVVGAVLDPSDATASEPGSGVATPGPSTPRPPASSPDMPPAPPAGAWATPSAGLSASGAAAAQSAGASTWPAAATPSVGATASGWGQATETAGTITATGATAGLSSEATSAETEEVRASPAARRLARELGVDIAAVAPGRRIRSEDVAAFAAARAQAPSGQDSADVAAAQARAVSGPGAANGASHSGAVQATPAARRLARARGLDLVAEPGGRLLRVADIEALSLAAQAASETTTAAAGAERELGARAVGGAGATAAGAGALGAGSGAGSGDRVLAAGDAAGVPRVLAGRRRVIAERMLASLQTMAQLTISMEVDVTEALRLRTQLTQLWGQDARPSITDLVSRAAILALKDHPDLNATLTSTPASAPARSSNTAHSVTPGAASAHAGTREAARSANAERAAGAQAQIAARSGETGQAAHSGDNSAEAAKSDGDNNDSQARHAQPTAVLTTYLSVNLGLAVDTPDGLIVPVIHQADSLSLQALAQASRERASRARDNTLSLDDLQRGTFTVTTLGALGVDVFTPIINPPQVAILGIGRTFDKLVLVDGKVEQRTAMHLSLSFDHRAVDGAPAARFLGTIKRLLELPVSLVVA